MTMAAITQTRTPSMIRKCRKKRSRLEKPKKAAARSQINKHSQPPRPSAWTVISVNTHTENINTRTRTHPLIHALLWTPESLRTFQLLAADKHSQLSYLRIRYTCQASAHLSAALDARPPSRPLVRERQSSCLYRSANLNRQKGIQFETLTLRYAFCPTHLWPRSLSLWVCG